MAFPLAECGAALKRYPVTVPPSAAFQGAASTAPCFLQQTMPDNHHTLAISIVHREAARTLSKGDFDLCMRIAKRCLSYLPDEYLANIRDTNMAARVFPAQLTPPLREVLGLMLWQTTPIANALRITGQTIDRKAEVEQAHALHWLLGFALQDGDNWQKTAAVALRKLTESIRPGETS